MCDGVCVYVYVTLYMCVYRYILICQCLRNKYHIPFWIGRKLDTIMHVVKRKHFLKVSTNSEASASEIQEHLNEMFHLDSPACR